MWVRAYFAIFLLVSPTAAFAQAEKRIALLIGNRAYDASVGILKNPHNDIAEVGEALAKQGFEVLPPIKDARRGAILGGVRELVRRLNTGGAGAIGFLYYSGHGAAEKDTNINYLIPVDAKEPGTTAFWDESLKLDDVLKLLDGARSTAKFIVFDACRNELQIPTKDTTKGLVPVAEQQGMFIAFASAPGRTASDRGDKSGPYAAALAGELGKPGVDHLSLFQNVKEAVYAATGGAQQPWESNGLLRRVYLTGPPTSAVTQPNTPARQLSEAAEAWDKAKDETNIAILESFVARYRDTFFADLARRRIEELKKQQAAILPPKPAPSAGRASCGNDGQGFQVWLDFFKRTAAEQGISDAVINSAFADVTYDPTVVQLDRSQRSFKLSLEEFYTRRVGSGRMQRGQSLMRTHQATLARIEQRFGVPAPILIAIWGLETNFGADSSGKYSILRSVATLAYDCRRSDFFSGHLLAALRILQRGDLTLVQMRGGWAGEIGHTMFLPSGYYNYAVDFDGDGRRDLERSIPDLLASTANFLKSHGWQAGQGWEPGSPNYGVLSQWNRAEVYQRTIAKFASELRRGA